jgi:hypothetical protein
VSRRTNRIITRISSVPMIAGTTRQPSGVRPKTFSPSPISHLPTSGCTDIEASGFQSPVVCPARMCLLAAPLSLLM